MAAESTWTPPDWFVRSFMRVLNFLIRPKLSEEQAALLLRNAAHAKGWAIDTVHVLGRDLHYYYGTAFLQDSQIPVVFMIDGRSGEVLLCNRVDEIDDPEDEGD